MNAQMMHERQRDIVERLNRGKLPMAGLLILLIGVMRLMKSVHGEEAHPERGAGEEVDADLCW